MSKPGKLEKTDCWVWWVRRKKKSQSAPKYCVWSTMDKVLDKPKKPQIHNDGAKSLEGVVGLDGRGGLFLCSG